MDGGVDARESEMDEEAVSGKWGMHDNINFCVAALGPVAFEGCGIMMHRAWALGVRLWRDSLSIGQDWIFYRGF